MNERIADLIELSKQIGREDRSLCLLGEGNTSVKLGADRMGVKASGAQLARLTEREVVTCDTVKVLALFEKRALTDQEIDQALMDSRVEGDRKPSVEALFHAWLLTLEGVEFIGHCHSLSANQVLCSPRARDFAERRLFPDEVVCCGPSSVFVPYTDPGLPLAREIRERVKQFMQQKGDLPRLILLQNHGLIAIGRTPQSVLAALQMADKAAAIFMGAAALGGPVFMTPQHVARIAGRPDEAYRQQQLKI